MIRLISAAAACGILMAAAQPAAADGDPPMTITPSQVDNPPSGNPDAGPEGLVSHYFEAMNAGDSQRAADMFARRAVIIDPFPLPYVWHSFRSWRAASVKVQRARHLTDFRMTSLSALSLSASSSGYEYCDIPVVMSFKMNGEPHTWKGIIAFTTAQTRNGWRITGLAMVTIGLESFWNNFPSASVPPQ
jgi:hypothetical protein